jgi:uncharacterized protein YeaO (DUF488 family)
MNSKKSAETYRIKRVYEPAGEDDGLRVLAEQRPEGQGSGLEAQG